MSHVPEYCPDVDTLRYRVHAQITLAQQDIRVLVSITALVSDREADQTLIHQRIHTALREFISADWVLSRIQREGETAGYERIQLQASARVSPEENHRLEERARRASREGLTLAGPQVDYSLPALRISEAVQQLREQILRDVQLQAGRFREVTGRDWRLGDVEFGVETGSWSEERRSGKGAYRSDEARFLSRDSDEDEAAILTGAERIMLIANVALKEVNQ